ncbi:uroporphyrinogen-III C-methyltransferase [Nannizzia gypsea CBS 118893]|uniref:uroporphyrinogen-III C-methyltransferase n=1 Tax=Arthroderma gypseum (strain ATCC MYA-4604 / CBS 118893) TaxID=535722 RepID=E4UWN5_ARTGP|nr:uroporphyrinogen-III C-methyltransferase [Nannizzia gypsea CBS 118893]EFR02578.1 uroporphyrinogen-III C-methyltransferase [Nannizzia gypsea CBS 118893]
MTGSPVGCGRRIPLLTAIDSRAHIHLIIGSNPLVAARITKSIDSGATPILISPPGNKLPSTLSERVENGQVQWIQREFQDSDLLTLGRAEVERVVDAVFVTLDKSYTLIHHISKTCRRLRIPVNVSDAPELCSFTLLSTYSDGPLHIGVTTSGKGGSLAARIRREIASFLPPGLGKAVENLGILRKRIWEEDAIEEEADKDNFEDDSDDSTAQKHTFNTLVVDATATSKTRRIRWLSQICEYWPLRQLASITLPGVEKMLEAYGAGKNPVANGDGTDSESKKGKIILAGSGPGHPDLITRATYHAIKTADLILSDKLVPAAVLDLIPRRTEVHIARKFPGNADKAQEELLEMASEGLSAGRIVLRLKQGDPYLYGRGAEEFSYFREKGYEPIVLPGITSALSAPLFADIPPTHRGVADQVLICTGTGRHGVAPPPPSYIPTQTVVFLMALHRLPSLIESMTTYASDNKDDIASSRRLWPKDTPCAVVERASCADQRVIRSTLENVCLAVQEEGSRPPGLLVVGKSCEVLHQPGQKWIVEDGFKALDGLHNDLNLNTITALGGSNGE